MRVAALQADRDAPRESRTVGSRNRLVASLKTTFADSIHNDKITYQQTLLINKYDIYINCQEYLFKFVS
jgi:hypothetical protein